MVDDYCYLFVTLIEPQGASHGELNQPSPWMMWRAISARPYLPGISDEDDAFSDASTDSAERRDPDYDPDDTWRNDPDPDAMWTNVPYSELASGDEVRGTAPFTF